MDRYVRQEKYLGRTAQEKISSATIAIVGLGALGSVASELLARAGVGKLILFDRDIVELQNLQRQSLYDEKDVNSEKATVIARKLKSINSQINIIPKIMDVNYKNIDIKADVVLDCTDNIETRLLLNDYCKKNNIPFIYASVAGGIGNLMVITKNSACYSCIFRDKGDSLNCETQGILNSASHIVAALEANEAIKIVTGRKHEEHLLHINLETNEISKIKVKSNPACEACSKKYDYLVQSEKSEHLDKIDFDVALCKTKAAYNVKTKKSISLDLKKLKNQFIIIAETPIVYVIKDKIEKGEIIVHNYGELIFKELTDIDKIKDIAERIYSASKK